MTPFKSLFELLGCTVLLMESYGLARAFSFGRQHAVNTDTKAIVKDNTTHEQATQLIHRWDKLNDHVGSKCILSTIAASAILFGCASTASPQPCHASITSTINIQSSSLIANKGEEEDYNNLLNLKPPTESKPQIKLPANFRNPSLSNERRPLIQGLVYFAEQQTMGSSFPQDYNYNDDLLVLTAVPLLDSNGDGPILAGAKIPITSVRFPFVFKMYKENMLLKSRDDVWLGSDGGEQQDVIVEARICPRDATKFPCNDRERKRGAVRLSLAKCSLGIFPVSLLIETVERLRNEKQYIDLLNYEKILDFKQLNGYQRRRSQRPESKSRKVAKVISGLPGLEEGEVVRAPASLPLQYNKVTLK